MLAVNYYQVFHCTISLVIYSILVTQTVYVYNTLYNGLIISRLLSSLLCLRAQVHRDELS